MALQWPAPLFTDGDFSGSVFGDAGLACSLPQFEFPIPATQPNAPVPNPVCQPYILKQDFMQFLLNWKPLGLGTPHFSKGMTPDYSSYVLVAEGPLRDMGAGLVRWTRTYAQIPATHYEWESYNMTYPGLVGFYSGSIAGTVWFFGRNKVQWRVTSMLQHDYFFVDPTGDSGHAGNDVTGNGTLATPYASANAIPEIYKFPFCAQQNLAILGQNATYGGPNFPQDWLANTAGYLNGSSGSPYVFASFPLESNYIQQCQDALTNGFSSPPSLVILTNNVSGTNPIVNTNGMVVCSGVSAPPVITPGVTNLTGVIAAEDSTLDRWMGNIFRRRTRYVLAR